MKSLYTLLLMTFCGASLFAQVGIGTTTPNANAVLELKSPGNNQGFLVPRLTTGERNAISLSGGDSGLMVYDVDEQKFYYWQSTQWLPIRSGSDVSLQAGAGVDITGNTISAVPDLDGDALNEIQDLALEGNNLTITNNSSATVIDLSPFADNDGSPSNEIQDLQLEGNNLSVTNNASATVIDLSPFIDADGSPSNEIQDLALSGNNLTITNNASATVIDLTPFTDGDGSATNEIQDLQLNGNTLTITNNASATEIDLAPFAGVNTDNQTLSFNSTTGVLGITGGNSVTVTPTGTAGGILSGTYPNPTLAPAVGNSLLSVLNNASTTSLLQANRLDGNVVLQTESPTGGVIGGSFGGGLQINDNAITTTKINDLAITTGKINNAAITTAKINDGAVTGPKIVDGAVTSAKLSSTGVSSGTYGTATAVPQLSVDAQGRITSVSPVTIQGVLPGGTANGDLSGTYPNPSIATTAGTNIVNAVNNASTTGVISPARLDASVVLNSETPTASDISGSFSSGLAINSNAVTTAKINAGAVSTAKLADGAVTTAKISDAQITPAKIAPSTIPGQVLTTVAGATVWNTLPALTGGTVTSITAGTGLTGGTITSTGTISVGSNAISSTLLQSDASIDANRAVTTNHIHNRSVTDTKLSLTGVGAATYGSATTVPQITVDAQGRITSASNVAISGGGSQDLAGTLTTGNDAKTLAAVNLGAVSVNRTDAPGALNVIGAHFMSFTMFDDGYEIKPTDYILISNPGKPASIELPSAAENRGRILIIRSQGLIGQEALTVTSKDGIDGAASSEPLFMNSTFGANTAYTITVISTGATWLTIDRGIASTFGRG